MVAERGNAKAQAGLGKMYQDGGGLQGMPRNYREALKWFRKAAEQGHAGAQAGLGEMYARGQGVPQHDKEAVKWFRKAAEQGNAGAQGALGYMYSKGQGVSEDYVKAYTWYNLAAAQGEEDAVEAKHSLRERMTPEQVANAQDLAADLARCIEADQAAPDGPDFR